MAGNAEIGRAERGGRLRMRRGTAYRMGIRELERRAQGMAFDANLALRGIDTARGRRALKERGRIARAIEILEEEMGK